MSWRIVGIRGLISSSAALPLMIDCPNLSPNPLNAWAAALSVRLTLTGSTFSAIEVIVWNSVLISVVTDLASMQGALFSPGHLAFCDVMCCGDRFFGEVNDTYFSPNTVVATIRTSTLAGIR